MSVTVCVKLSVRISVGNRVGNRLEGTNGKCNVQFRFSSNGYIVALEIVVVGVVVVVASS